VGVVVGVVVSALDPGPAGPLVVLGSVLLLAVAKAGSCRPAPNPTDAA
jgi:hypothetical protein